MSGQLLFNSGNITSQKTAEDIWIFGFGSLIWKPGFQYAQRVEGYIKNFKRVFYQGSTDHRGTPLAPGRTVTLEYSQGCRVWGAAYLLAGTWEEQIKILKKLEWREKQYDVREFVSVFDGDTDLPIITRAIVYIATPNKASNVDYLGPAPLEDIAKQIANAHGPSGPNSEYLFRLAEATRKMGVEDVELEWLASRVKELLESKEIQAGQIQG